MRLDRSGEGKFYVLKDVVEIDWRNRSKGENFRDIMDNGCVGWYKEGR